LLIKKDINFIAERSNNMNVRFENLFRRHYKSWMNRKVRSVNLSLDQALLVCGKSYVHVIDTTLFLWEKFTAHGLHLNS